LEFVGDTLSLFFCTNNIVQLTACSLEIISQISQPDSSVFLSQKTSQQYIQPDQLKRTGYKSARALHMHNTYF
jgi:hypothetical protein